MEFVGSVLVRFERSTLPEHEGTRSIVLRILDIITPVKCVIPNYDSHVCQPRKGELHRRGVMYYNDPNRSVWRFDIDNAKGLATNKIARGFRLLWDA